MTFSLFISCNVIFLYFFDMSAIIFHVYSFMLFSIYLLFLFFFFFSSRRRHTRWPRDWSSDVCSSDLGSPSGVTSFINERLTFTHGMGLTLGPVSQVTPEGLPVLFIKDLPPASSVSLRVTRPELYFGELTDDRKSVV